MKRRLNMALRFGFLLLLTACGGGDAPPAVPTGLSATAGNGQVTLSWNPNSEDDLARYIIFQGTTSGDLSQVDSVSAGTTSYTADGFSNGTTYFFAIAAEDEAGNISDKTDEVSATPSAPAQPGTVQFSTADFGASEGDGSITIVVTRTGGSDGAISVDYATSDGTATAGSDYSSTLGTLSWNNGDSSPKTFAIPITDDGADEPAETVNLTLSNVGGGAALGTTSSATLTIEASDSPSPLPTCVFDDASTTFGNCVFAP